MDCMPEPLIDVGDRKQLFIDDRWFDEATGIHFRLRACKLYAFQFSKGQTS